MYRNLTENEIEKFTNEPNLFLGSYGKFTYNNQTVGKSEFIIAQAVKFYTDEYITLVVGTENDIVKLELYPENLNRLEINFVDSVDTQDLSRELAWVIGDLASTENQLDKTRYMVRAIDYINRAIVAINRDQPIDTMSISVINSLTDFITSHNIYWNNKSGIKQLVEIIKNPE